MLSTSENYDENIVANTRRIEARVIWGFYDINASENTTITADEAIASKKNQILDEEIGETVKYATCEGNLWQLDGSFAIWQDNNYHIGYWSAEVSDENCEISETLTLNLSEPATSVGMTLNFDILGIATDFEIAYYKGTTLKETVEVTDNQSVSYKSDVGVIDFNKVVITFTATQKTLRRIKLLQLIYGVIINYTADDIISLKTEEIISPFADTLADNAITLTVENYAKTLNIRNPQGIVKFLQQRQQMECSLGIAGDFLGIGNMFLYSWKNDAQKATATFELRTPLTFITGNFEPTEFGTASAKSLLESIFANCGISDYEIHSSLNSVMLNNYVPSMENRKAMQLIANASGAVIEIARTGKFFVSPISYTATDKTIDYDNANYPIVTQGDIAGILETAYTVYANDGTATATSVTKTVDENLSTSTKNISNDFLADEATALSMLNAYAIWQAKRLKYEQTYRGDMAVLAGDTVAIEDDFGSGIAYVTEINLNYDGTLSSDIIAYGGVEND